MAKAIPRGYHALTPSIVVDNAADAIEFYKRAFSAPRSACECPRPAGAPIGHAEIEIEIQSLMLSDPFPQATVKPPKQIGGTSVGIFMYVDDVDEVVQQAVDAGAKVSMPVEDQSGAIASGRSPTRLAMSGCSPRTSKISQMKRSRSVAKPPWPRWAELRRRAAGIPPAALACSTQRLRQRHTLRR